MEEMAEGIHFGGDSGDSFWRSRWGFVLEEMVAGICFGGDDEVTGIRTVESHEE